jgi:hypothetical protein
MKLQKMKEVAKDNERNMLHELRVKTEAMLNAEILLQKRKEDILM